MPLRRIADAQAEETGSNRRMRIAVASRAVGPLHGWGGLERAVDDLCTTLMDQGHRVTLFTATGEPTGDGSQPKYGLVTVPWSRGIPLRRGSVLDRLVHYPRFVRRLTAAIAERETAFDAAIGHGAAAAAFVPLRATGRIGRLLVNPHGMEEFSARGLKGGLLARQRSLVRNAARHADAVIALDTHLVADVMHNLGVPRQQVAIVPNGIDVGRIDALTGAIDAAGGELPTIVSVGRMEANKGLDVLAAALGAHRDRLPTGWRWHHVGDGSARAAVQMAIARAGIAGHVALCGAVSDAELHRQLAGAALFVHPTRYEGSPLVILEAMAHRLPIVASAVGGIPDKIVPGETGWLVPPGDHHALGDAIVAALTLPAARRRAMGARARGIVLAQFSLPHVVDELIAVLAALPARPPRGGSIAEEAKHEAT